MKVVVTITADTITGVYSSLEKAQAAVLSRLSEYGTVFHCETLLRGGLKYYFMVGDEKCSTIYFFKEFIVDDEGS